MRGYGKSFVDRTQKALAKRGKNCQKVLLAVLPSSIAMRHAFPMAVHRSFSESMAVHHV